MCTGRRRPGIFAPESNGLDSSIVLLYTFIYSSRIPMTPKYGEILAMLKQEINEARSAFEEESRMIRSGRVRWEGTRPKAEAFGRAITRYTDFLLGGEIPAELK
jgi:hypothetical protein